MNESIRKQITGAIKTHERMIAELEARDIETITITAEAIIKSLNRNSSVYLCGNGSTEADAQHIASEFVGRSERQRQGLSTVALTTDISVITAILMTTVMKMYLLNRSKRWLEKVISSEPSQPVALQ